MQRNLKALENTEFDLLVIGAGIHGACIARDAALRGLKVALIDKQDLCSATSHNSLKTIHGGIRYLQHFNIKRTLESIKEQHIWLKTAPHLTKPLPFLMPTYGHGTRGKLMMTMGIVLYEILGWSRNRALLKDKKLMRGRIMNKSKLLASAPFSQKHKLTGGATWTDAQIEQADRAVLELCEQTSQLDGCIANYVEAVGLLIDEKTSKIYGVNVIDACNPHAQAFSIRAKTVINAAGPWVCKFLHNSNACYNLQVDLTKSMNLVTTKSASQYAIGLQSKRESDAKIGSSKRLYFLVPWLGKTILGTTHFPFKGDINRLGYDEHEMQQFLNEVNEAYKGIDLNLDDILYCYQGLTPANDDDKNTKASRAHHSRVIDHSNDGIAGLYSVVSVKWTTARAVAKRAVDYIAQNMATAKACTTHKTPVLDSFRDMQNLADKNDAQLRAICLIHIEQTMAAHLSDMLLRRTNDLVLDRLHTRQIALIVSFFQEHFNWSSHETHRQLINVYNSGLGRSARHKLQHIIDTL